MFRFSIRRETWYKLIAVLLAVVTFGTIHVCYRDVLNSRKSERSTKTPAPKRNVDARIARAEAEAARITKKYEKNGIFPFMKLKTHPEVALPLVLALLEEELAEFGIKRDEQTAAIEAAPEKFRIGVPEHRRQRFMLLTPEQEKALGDRAERELASGGKIYHDPATEARVHRIAERLWKVLPAGTPHRIVLLVDDEVNAFCLANGTVCINSGTLKRISSDDVIAFLLAHEYAHYLARHSGETATKKLLALALEVLVEQKQMDMEKEGKIVRPLLLRLGYVGGSYVGVYLPFSRLMEKEADTLGIRYMARAGFDPNGAIEFFVQQEKLNGTPGWEKFLSTHPTDRKRLDRMRRECAKIKRAKKKAH